MPPVSKKQAKFLRGVSSGSIKAPGLTPGKADEMVSGYPTKGLPEKAESGKSSQRRRQSMKKKSKGKPKGADRGDMSSEY